MEIYAHIGGTPLGMAFDRHDNLYVCIGGMGLYRVTPAARGREGDRRDQPQLCLGQRRQPAAPGRRPRHLPTTAASSSPRPRCATRCTSGPPTGWRRAATAASSATTRARGRRTPCSRDLKFPNGVCIASDGQSFLFAETWGCTRQAPLVRRAEGRAPPSWCSTNLPGFPGQHQQLLRRPLLDVAGRHALPGARPGVEDAGLPPPHGQARAARRVAVPEHQHRLRAEVQRAAARCSRRCGTWAARTTR